MSYRLVETCADVLVDLIDSANEGNMKALLLLYGDEGKLLCKVIRLPYDKLWDIVYNGKFDDDYGDSPYGRIGWTQ